jgi:hypothetical protein
MSDAIYYCTNKNNTCQKKESCKRYLDVDGKNHATLFKFACTENNNYLLFMDKETKENDTE